MPWLSIFVSIALTIASTLWSQYSASQQKKQPPAGIHGTLQTGGDTPMSFVLGVTGVDGKLEYANTYGNDGETPNAFLTLVISFQDLLASGLVGLYVDRQKITLSTSDSTTHGYSVPEYVISGRKHLFWRFLDGSQTTADTFLTAKFGSDPEKPWLSDMIGRGIAYVTLTSRVNKEGLWNGIPTYKLQVRGIPLYDVRKDSEAGGSGDHRIDDPDTWEFSSNPAVMIYNILLGIRYEGAWVWGMDEPVHQARLPYAVWATAMNACDAEINLKGGGTEKRFRAGREVRFDERPLDVINDLLIGCTGRMAEIAGVYTIVIGDPGAAVATFTDADIILSEQLSLEMFPTLDDSVNGATATYLEPDQAWEPKETDPRYYPDYVAEDDGRPKLAGLELHTVFSNPTAQRVLKATVRDARRFKRWVAVLHPKWGRYHPLEVIAWTSVSEQYSAKAFLITSRSTDGTGRPVFGLQEVDPSDHAWAPIDDEQDFSTSPVVPSVPPAQPMTGWSATAIPDTAGRRFFIRITYKGGLDDVRAVRVQIREKLGAQPVVFDSGATDYDITDADPVVRDISGSFLLPATQYQVAGIFLPPDGSPRVTTWSAWIDVTTPAIYFGSEDVFGLEVINLGNELANAHGLLTGDDPAAVPTLIANLLQRQQELALALIDANATTKEVLRVLAAQHNGVNAAVIHQDLVIASETEARATAITEAIATFGDAIGAWSGTASVINGDATVTALSGPVLTDDNCAAGATVTIGASTYQVASRTSGTVFELAAPYGSLTRTENVVIAPFVEIPEVPEFTLADGYLEIDSVADALAGTARITAKTRARAGDNLAQAGWMLKSQADFAGNTIQQFGVLGAMYIYRSELDEGIPVFSVDEAGNVHAASLTFDSLLKSSATSGGTPLIYLNGLTGFFSFGA